MSELGVDPARRRSRRSSGRRSRSPGRRVRWRSAPRSRSSRQPPKSMAQAAERFVVRSWPLIVAPGRDTPGGISSRRRRRTLQRLQRGDDLGRCARDPRRVVDVPDAEDDVLGAGIGQLAEPLDDLGRGLAAAPPSAGRGRRSGASTARSPRGRARRRRSAVEDARTCGRCFSGEPKTLQASAYWATSRRVFRSPPPPIMIGDARPRDRLRGVEQARRPEVAALEGRLASRARPDHIPWAIAERLLEHLEADAERREREARARATPPRSRPPRCRARPVRRTARRGSSRP